MIRESKVPLEMRTTGVSPRARAFAAMRMTNLPIAEIALRLGFANQSHFTSAFTRSVGMTPRRFRAA